MKDDQSIASISKKAIKDEENIIKSKKKDIKKWFDDVLYGLVYNDDNKYTSSIDNIIAASKNPRAEQCIIFNYRNVNRRLVNQNNYLPLPPNMSEFELNDFLMNNLIDLKKRIKVKNSKLNGTVIKVCKNYNGQCISLVIVFHSKALNVKSFRGKNKKRSLIDVIKDLFV